MKKLKFLVAALFVLMAAGAEAQTESVVIDGDHGKLQAVIHKPTLKQGERVPMVLLCHGFMGNKDGALENRIANLLSERGIASIRFDFNGHGQSEGRFQDMTVPNEIVDAKKVIDYVSALPYVSSVAISGHSQGGVVAAMTAGELGSDKIKAVVLLAPAAVLRDDAIRGSTMGATYDPFNLGEYVELFRGLKLGAEYIRTAFSLPIYETSAQYQGPALIIHGTGDRVVPYTYGERFHQIWPKSKLQIIDRADHGFSKEIEQVATSTAEFLSQTLLSTK
ncbi:MAG: alpha/beta fold hydrolase [Alistipes sp.]|nr:alpha/beta fold hydrolase [Alistipes sp.]